MPSEAKNRLSIIIPCKDEEQAVDLVIDRYLQARQRLLNETVIEDVELIVVDDCSQDDSLILLQKHARKGHLKLISLPQSLGYGGALKVGLQTVSGELIAFYDMDYTYDPMDLVEMSRELIEGEVEMVSGDRLSRLEGMPWTRTLGNTFFVHVIRSIFRIEVQDCCSGMRIFRRKYLKPFIQLLPNNLSFTLVMTILFLRFEIPFSEKRIRYGKRVGRSKLSVLWDGPVFLSTILFYWFQYRFYQKKIGYASSMLGLRRVPGRKKNHES